MGLKKTWKKFGLLDTARDPGFSARFMRAVEWTLTQLQLPDVQATIFFSFDEEDENTLGSCSQSHFNNGEPYYHVDFSPEIKRENVLIKTMMHELTHVSQYLSGRLSIDSVYNRYWDGSLNDADYWDRPWEVEAREMEEKLYFSWKKLTATAGKGE